MNIHLRHVFYFVLSERALVAENAYCAFSGTQRCKMNTSGVDETPTAYKSKLENYR